GEDPEDERDDPDGARRHDAHQRRRVRPFDADAHGAAAGLRLSFRRAFQTERMSRSAPTKSTIRPWMMYVRLVAACGSITPDWSPWVVPKSSAPKRSAPSRMPGAVFLPRSATAIPRKPICEAGLSDPPKR